VTGTRFLQRTKPLHTLTTGNRRFWASDAPAVAAVGTPEEPLILENATAISRIYPDASGGPAWNPYGLGPMLIKSSRLSASGAPFTRTWPPVPSGANYRVIHPSGRAILEAHGLVFGRANASGG